MGMELNYMNLIIPIEKIEKYYPGVFEQYKRDNKNDRIEYDEYIVMKSAMCMEDIENFAKEFEDLGLVGVLEKDGTQCWQDFCIVDVVLTHPCDWVWHDGTSIYHIDELK